MRPPPTPQTTPPTRGALYTDRPIYRPGQVVYYRGVLRLDDDASYQVPGGRVVTLTALTYGNGSETRIYTGTATLSAFGTFRGQFTLPAGAPVGEPGLSFPT